jgi:hypothetical protein
MDENETRHAAGVQGCGHNDRPLGRTLEEVLHLFLSRKTGEEGASDRTRVRSPDPSPPPAESRGGAALLRPVSLTKDRLAAILMESDGALEEGLRAIDAKIPCRPCGEIDLLAVDRATQLAIIDFDTTVGDGLLLRGIGHFDWVVRNMPNVQRMYRGRAINFSLPPRLFLLAPQFSPMLRSAARQITRPQIHWIRYHAVEASGSAGILFEPGVGE